MNFFSAEHDDCDHDWLGLNGQAGGRGRSAKGWTMLIFIQWTAAQKKEKVWKEKRKVFAYFHPIGTEMSGDMGMLQPWDTGKTCRPCAI